MKPPITFQLARPLLSRSQRRTFLSSTPRTNTNRIFDPIRRPDELHNLTLISAADNRPLITLWSAKWCSTCQVVKPLIRGLIEEERVGEAEGGLGFAEVEIDSSVIRDLPITYRISSMPTLLAFSRQEAQFDTRLTRPEDMRKKEFLRDWLINEAKRGGRAGGGGGSMFRW